MQDKISVTMRIDREIIDGFKALAEKTPGARYQAIMSDVLRDYLAGMDRDSVESRLARLENKVLK